MDFLIRYVCPDVPCFHAVGLHLRGLKYDNRRMSVMDFGLYLSLSLNERLFTKY
jgi:hypothetical protein